MDRSSDSERSEPFQSSGSEYRPSGSSSDSEVEVSAENQDNRGAKKRGRKKIRHVAGWSRNVQKQKRARGESYESVSTGKMVSERKQGKECRCAKECIKKLSDEEKQEIFSYMF